MAETSPLAETNKWLRFLKALRPAVLIPGIVGGSTLIIIFPAATSLLLAYAAVTIAAIGMLAWTGMIALATAAAAALIVPIATVFAVLGVIAGVRAIAQRASTRAVTNNGLEQAPTTHRDDATIALTLFQESLDDWETDGGPAPRVPRAPSRRPIYRSRIARRRRPA
jgi:hypothetical protein